MGGVRGRRRHGRRRKPYRTSGDKPKLTNAQLWERCWSNARVYLGLSSSDFFRLTPRQYRALMDRQRERTEHEDHQREFAAALVAHTIATYAGKQLKEGVHLAYGDFMPSQRPKLESARRKTMASSLRDYLHGLAKDKGLA